MNRFLTGLLALLVAVPALAAMQFDAKIWRGLQKTDVRSLSKDIGGRVGQLVEVHCNFRGKDIHHMKPGWYECSLWQPDPNGHKGFSDVRVMVSQKDLATFKTLPTDSTSAADITLYGKVLRDSEAHFLFIRLIGRTAAVDPAGNVTVSW